MSVSSDSPVVVERLIVFSGIGDLSLQPGVPVVDDLDDLEPLG